MSCHNHKYIDLNVDMSKFRLRYCDNQTIVFTHINDPLELYRSYVSLSCDNWMGSELIASLYIDSKVVNNVSQLDAALVELDKIFST